MLEPSLYTPFRFDLFFQLNTRTRVWWRSLTCFISLKGVPKIRVCYLVEWHTSRIIFFYLFSTPASSTAQSLCYRGKEVYSVLFKNPGKQLVHEWVHGYLPVGSYSIVSLRSARPVCVGGGEETKKIFRSFCPYPPPLLPFKVRSRQTKEWRIHVFLHTICILDRQTSSVLSCCVCIAQNVRRFYVEFKSKTASDPTVGILTGGDVMGFKPSAFLLTVSMVLFYYCLTIKYK